MDAIAVDVTGVRVTALVTLYAHARESRDRRSILRDSWAGDAVRRLDFDFGELGKIDYTRFTIAARSRQLDAWVTNFLARHRDGVVVDLGCGLDSRVFRVDPPAGHHWYDVDFPDIVAIRNRLYPRRPDHTAIGASVADPAWLARVPGDRPAIVVADSLLMFLAEDDVRALFRRVVDRFPRGEFVFTAYSSMVKRREAKRGRDPFFDKHDVEPTRWTLDDPREVERFDERLRCVDRLSQVDVRLHQLAPLYDRLMCALIGTTPAGRYAGSILRYRF